MRRIVVTDATFPTFESERAIADRHGATFYEAHCVSQSDVINAADKADILLVQFAQITNAVIERLAPGAAIVRYGLGLDNIDAEAAYKKGVRVAYVPDYATAEVADHTAALILAMARRIVPLDRSVRAGKWEPVEVCRSMLPFAEMVMGFVGFGRIARELHTRLNTFGFKSIASDPYVDIAAASDGKSRAVELDALFATADVVTLHLPLDLTTKHIVNKHRLSLMKQTSIVVNTARGGLIDTAALEDALATKRISGAALDVFEEEPLPMHSRLRELPNVILTPHAAWYSSNSAKRVQFSAADEIDRHLSGQPARCPAPLPRLSP